MFWTALTEPEDIQFVDQVHRAYPDFPLLRTLALLKGVDRSYQIMDQQICDAGLGILILNLYAPSINPSKTLIITF